MAKKKTVSGTREWASHNLNRMNGCLHDCKYCYAKALAVRTKRRTPETWVNEMPKEKPKEIKKKKGTIMYPTAHDITPTNAKYTISYLGKILKKGNNVLVVSKPHLECIKEICDTFTDYKEQILFRFTICSADDNVLAFWEPGAPSFLERAASLMYAYEAGYKTSVSCEPMLDEEIHKVVEGVQKYITDAIWLGKMNSPKPRIALNGRLDKETEEAADKIIAYQSNDANMMKLYKKYKNHSLIKWKESMKKVIGIEVPTEKGLDI